ncbi:pleckstrin homology domain-containing family A member 8-like isoform X2 [Mya arenaria]|uniref:pleckstrin homology domain-containing family A member 8-like isoform X2 n=1 Tax=Mya arenaria TaxID=6604 RepID=UPI0022E77430|nr:pleckstrin homology domain-containing family A member 8-like isoform X2 [Mya arenaria]
MYIAGTLWKWTNYFSGWQERWFVLDNGILSYYKSEDDVNTGCKGSVKMSVCDIAVHATDHTRLDLIIPGEQHFYLKASNPKERQQWLVAMGSTKASMGKANEEPEDNSKDVLKKKRSELRLYCDLLMQQIHSVKHTVVDQGTDSQFDDASSLIHPTCDMFIKTLEECMELVQIASVNFEAPHSPITDAALPPSPLHRVAKKKHKNASRQNSQERSASRSPSISSAENIPPLRTSSTPQPTRQNSAPSSSKISPRTFSDSDSSGRDRAYSDSSVRHSNFSVSKSSQNSSSFDGGYSKGNLQYTANQSTNSQTTNSRLQNISETGTVQSVENGVKINGKSETSLKVLTSKSNERQSDLTDDATSDCDVFLDPMELRVPTFFSVMSTSLVDIRLQPDGGIPVEPFLEACKNVLPVFDKLNSTAFAPVKMDFQGNIRKVKTKYQVNPEEFSTLQRIVKHEITKKQQFNPSSASMALLWLKRSLEFISGFLNEIRQGEENLSVAATNAYSTSLKPFHGWVVRGVFAVAVKALPYRSTFLPLLDPSPNREQTDKQSFLDSLMSDIESFCDASKVFVDILDDYFKSNGLNVEEQI